SSLRLDGRWSAPQPLRFLRDDKEAQSIEVEDQLVGSPTTESNNWQAAATATRAAMAVANTPKQTVEDLRRAAEDYEDKAVSAMRYEASLDPLKRPQPEP